MAKIKVKTSVVELDGDGNGADHAELHQEQAGPALST